MLAIGSCSHPRAAPAQVEELRRSQDSVAELGAALARAGAEAEQRLASERLAGAERVKVGTACAVSTHATGIAYLSTCVRHSICFTRNCIATHTNNT